MWDAAVGLALPALYFVTLAVILKQKTLIADIVRVRKESELNLQIMVFDVFFVLPMIAVVAGGLNEMIVNRGYAIFSPDIWIGVPTYVTIVVAVFIGDFTGYWRHRLEHTRILWPSHAVHHSDTEMTWLTLAGFHPFNRLTTFTIDSAVLLWLGLPPFAVIANALVRQYYGYFIHADLPWTYGPLGKVFVSPAMHRWHHAKDPRYFQTNFATVFSIFDRAFGTFRVPGPCDVALGVTDDMAPTLVGQLAICSDSQSICRADQVAASWPTTLSLL